MKLHLRAIGRGKGTMIKRRPMAYLEINVYRINEVGFLNSIFEDCVMELDTLTIILKHDYLPPQEASR